MTPGTQAGVGAGGMHGRSGSGSAWVGRPAGFTLKTGRCRRRVAVVGSRPDRVVDRAGFALGPKLALGPVSRSGRFRARAGFAPGPRPDPVRTCAASDGRTFALLCEKNSRRSGEKNPRRPREKKRTTRFQAVLFPLVTRSLVKPWSKLVKNLRPREARPLCGGTGGATQARAQEFQRGCDFFPPGSRNLHARPAKPPAFTLV